MLDFLIQTSNNVYRWFSISALGMLSMLFSRLIFGGASDRELRLLLELAVQFMGWSVFYGLVYVALRYWRGWRTE